MQTISEDSDRLTSDNPSNLKIPTHHVKNKSTVSFLELKPATVTPPENGSNIVELGAKYRQQEKGSRLSLQDGVLERIKMANFRIAKEVRHQTSKSREWLLKVRNQEEIDSALDSERMDDIDQTGIDQDEGTTLASPGHLSGSVSRVSPIRVSKISTGPMSPEKQECEESERKEQEAKTEERRKYEQDLSDLMDMQMQHIAELIAQKRKLEDHKAKLTTEVNHAFQELAHQREKLAEKKRELELEEQLSQDRKRALESFKGDIKLARREARQKEEFSQQEEQYYLKRADKLLKDLEVAKSEREAELEGLFIEAEANQKKKTKLTNRLKQLTEEVDQLRDKVEYQKKLETSHNSLFIEKRKFMKELILNESLAGAMISSKASKNVIDLASDINKKLKQGRRT